MKVTMTKTTGKLLFLTALLSSNALTEQLSGGAADEIESLVDDIESFANDVSGKDGYELDLEGGSRTSAMLIKMAEFNDTLVEIALNNRDEISEVYDRLVAAKLVDDQVQKDISELADDPADEDEGAGAARTGTDG